MEGPYKFRAVFTARDAHINAVFALSGGSLEIRYAAVLLIRWWKRLKNAQAGYTSTGMIISGAGI